MPDRSNEFLPEFATEMTRSLYEHEVYLRFVDDEYAFAFHEWWHWGGGKDSFTKHCIDEGIGE